MEWPTCKPDELDQYLTLLKSSDVNPPKHWTTYLKQQDVRAYSNLRPSTKRKHFREFFYVCNVTFALLNATFAVIIVTV